jgi:NTP pyrophosphatase (non-canonical NTP hydrolase)
MNDPACIRCEPGMTCLGYCEEAMKRADLLPDTFEGKLGNLVEECGEFLQAYGKYIRFGATPTDTKTGKSYDNVADMKAEMRDIAGALNRLGIET